jgi:hypothetical protein
MHRLSSALALSVLLLIGLLLSTNGVIAQDDGEGDQHPLVGTWLLDSEADNPDNPLEVDVITSDGAFIGVEADGSVTLGAWEATGDQTANLTVWSILPEEEGSGTAIIRVSVEVAEDGATFTAEYTLELIGPDGTTMGDGEYGPATATATRLSVEPMGTPVGTFEDLFSLFGGEEDATPEP